ncbi:MAG: hypothetical protein ACK5MT_20630 [Actinomycetales bacterium]
MSRLAINQHGPEGYQAVAALDGYVRRHLDHVLLDLVKLRASQGPNMTKPGEIYRLTGLFVGMTGFEPATP